MKSIPVLKRSTVSAASVGAVGASSLPEAILVREGKEEAHLGQRESTTSGVKPELVDDPLLTDADVKKMMLSFSDLFKYTNQLVARSKEKSEQLKAVGTVSAEEHALSGSGAEGAEGATC